MTELETLRERVAELEVAMKYFLDRTWFNLISDTLPDSHVVSMDARVGDLRRAASLLSDLPDAERTPEQRAALDELLRDDGELYDAEPDVVERVAKAIWEQQGYCKDDLDDPFQRLSWEELNEIEADYAPTVAHTMDLARAAIAAMRPAIDAEKVAEIAARHEDADMMLRDTGSSLDAEAVHADRAALLKMIGGLKDE
jgi:hypothetical protein